jgi:hypothetical protein
MSDATGAPPGADRTTTAGIDRRQLIKRAAIAGGVVAWTAPTIQALGSNVAWAGKAKKSTGGTVVVCENKAKPTDVTYAWNGLAACGPAGTVVYITVTGTGALQSIANGVADSTTAGNVQVHGTEDMTFTVKVDGNNQVLTVRTGSHAGPVCQAATTFHVSCSQTPPVQPGYVQGGIELYDWFIV